MGRIVVQVMISNVLEPSFQIRCDALVDTGTGGMVLPAAWKERLGPFPASRRVEMETADQRVVVGEVCGPVQIQIEGFEPVFNEVTFIPMDPTNGRYEPLLGYIILEQSRLAVDPVGHRLVRLKYMDLK